jgi:hypothetical protein
VKIYQSNAPFPTRVHAIVSLIATKKESMSSKEIKEILSPSFMGNDDLFNDLLNSVFESGILLQEHGLISLVDQTPSGMKIDKKSVKANFPMLFADFVLQANLPNGDENSFALLAAWFLKQDPLTLPPSSRKDLLVSKMEDAGFDVQSLRLNNNAQQDNFIAWCNYLGLCTLLHERMIPDPTTFLRWHWKELKDLAKNKKVKIIDFYNKVGQLCPVLDSGAVCKSIKDKEPTYPDGYFSKSLSLAMIRLEKEGFFKIHYEGETRDGMNIYQNSNTKSSVTELRRVS